MYIQYSVSSTNFGLEPDELYNKVFEIVTPKNLIVMAALSIVYWYSTHTAPLSAERTQFSTQRTPSTPASIPGYQTSSSVFP